MKDLDCVAFLQWALPQMGLEWHGFRKVRKQVCRRIGKRIRYLELADVHDYRQFLAHHCDEWAILDSLCYITISRFLRDRRVFDFLRHATFPRLIKRLQTRRDTTFSVWSAGCSSGEESYSLSLLWHFSPDELRRCIEITINATDVNETCLARARRACYAESSVKDIPSNWLEQAFEKRGDLYCLHSHLRQCVHFIQHDIRHGPYAGPYELILCRNLAFTYFDKALQQQTLRNLAKSLSPGGVLVIGAHEQLPNGMDLFEPSSLSNGVYERKNNH